MSDDKDISPELKEELTDAVNDVLSEMLAAYRNQVIDACAAICVEAVVRGTDPVKAILQLKGTTQ